MIKTYKARVNNNNISYMLNGKNGNQMRYQFTNGNVVTNKYPTLTLRNRYCQDLLESSLLFKSNTIVLDHEEEEYEGEKAKLKAEENTPVQEPQPVTAPNPKVITIPSVTSADELLAFVNEADDREGTRCFKVPTSALEWATKHNYYFPNYNPA